VFEFIDLVQVLVLLRGIVVLITNEEVLEFQGEFVVGIFNFFKHFSLLALLQGVLFHQHFLLLSVRLVPSLQVLLQEVLVGLLVEESIGVEP